MTCEQAGRQAAMRDSTAGAGDRGGKAEAAATVFSAALRSEAAAVFPEAAAAVCPEAAADSSRERGCLA